MRKKKHQILLVACPRRGHVHELELSQDPDNPDLLIAECGGQVVVRKPNPEYHQTVTPTPTYKYVVPKYSEKESEDVNDN